MSETLKAKARAMRTDGLDYQAIADALGKSRTTIYRWCNEDAAEADRARSRDYKRRNREALRAYDRAYGLEHRGNCQTCGEVMGIRTDDGICRSCILKSRMERGKQIEQMWLEGRSLQAIADEIGTSVNVIGVTMSRMRAEGGWNLPQRRPRSIAA